MGVEWLREFAERYPSEIGLPFYCLVRPTSITPEVAHLLRRAGCHTVRMGVESGDPHIRNIILRRKMSNDQILEAAQSLKREGIRLEIIALFGLPHETVERAWRTVELILKAKPDGFFTNMLTLFPGTDIADYSLKEGLIDAESLRKINRGELGRMQGESILNQPSRYFLTNIKVLAPFLKPFPYLKGLVKRISYTHHTRLIHLFYFFSIPCMSFWESMQRLRETFRALVRYTMKRYRKTHQRKSRNLSLK
jgi:radical SAM superfamily enzyme YgiQ (UPF0313 family)